MELIVTVTDVLNQAPQWDDSAYWVTVPESIARDTKIVVCYDVFKISYSHLRFRMGGKHGVQYNSARISSGYSGN